MLKKKRIKAELKFWYFFCVITQKNAQKKTEKKNKFFVIEKSSNQKMKTVIKYLEIEKSLVLAFKNYWIKFWLLQYALTILLKILPAYFMFFETLL